MSGYNPLVLDIIELHEAVDRYEELVSSSSFSIKGGSDVVAIAYLMVSQGIGYRKVLTKIKRIDPQFTILDPMERILMLYERLLKVTPRSLVSKAIEIGRRYEFGRGVGHASKVLELSIELVSKLEEISVVKINCDVERALYVASILHDVGVSMLGPNEPDDMHREYSHRIILENRDELDNACGCSVAEKAAIIARLHGKADPIPPYLDTETKTAIGIIRIADGLDYTLDQSVTKVEVSKNNGEVLIKAYCNNWCTLSIQRANKKKKLLEETLGAKISIEPV